MLVTADTDLTLHDLEKGLKRERFTANYHAVPHNEVLLADALNERIPNLYGAVYGGIEDLCVKIRLAQADGGILENVLAPRSAVGPSFKKLAIGSEELLGIPIQATLKIFHRPEFRELALVVFSSSQRMHHFERALARSGTTPPLLCPLSKNAATQFLKRLGGGESVLGLAFWGGRDKVQNGLKYMQELTIKKNGTWFRVEGNLLEEKFWERLHREAIENLQKTIQLNTKEVTASHRKLARRIQEIA